MVNVPLEPGVQWQSHAGLQAAKERVEHQLNGRGRVLIRASGTEPKLRLMVEAEDAALAEEGVRQLVAVNLAA
jgi:phosphoglucosamine mutase